MSRVIVFPVHENLLMSMGIFPAGKQINYFDIPVVKFDKKGYLIRRESTLKLVN